MSKEILHAVEILSNEKELDRESIFEALEIALAAAAKKKYKDDVGTQVDIDRETGEYSTFQVWEVLDGDAEDTYMDYPDKQLWLIDAVDEDADVKPGEFIREPIDSVGGRIAAQAVMQVIKQKIRESERSKIVDEYESKVGELVSGIVKRNDRGRLILDLGNNVDAVVPRDKVIPRDPVRLGDRVRGYLEEINPENKGPMLILSRTSNEFLEELFKLEVPEIGEGVIDILGVAREAGNRAKIAVRSNDQRLDPVGACVGIRGARVQAVSNELAGERVDIVVWDENEAQYVINAVTPAEIASIVVDEDTHVMDLAAPEDQLSKAIGRNGQNIRLASELTGWTLNVMSIDEFNEKTAAESNVLVSKFAEELDVDEEVANILVQEGYTTLEEVAYIPEEEMLAVEEFDESMVEEIRSRAQDVLVTRAILQEEEIESHGPAEDLLGIEGMDERTAFLLAGAQIITMEDLAEQAVDEVMEIKGIKLSEEEVGALIMIAREPWFADEEKK